MCIVHDTMARERLLLFILTVCCVLPAPSAGGDEKEAVGLILVLSNSTKYNSVKSVEAVREGIKDVNKKSGLLTEYQLEIADEIVPQVCCHYIISCEVHCQLLLCN